MELNKILDYAIMADETSKNPDIKAGYIVGGRPYDNYLDNTSFAKLSYSSMSIYKDLSLY